MSALPDNPTDRSAQGGMRRQGRSGWLLLVLGVVLGSGGMFFLRRPAEPPAPVSSANSSPADNELLPAATAPNFTGYDQPTLTTRPAVDGGARYAEDPFSAEAFDDTQPPAKDPAASFVPVPVVDGEGSAEISVDPVDDEPAAAARLAHATEVVDELRRLTRAQREAQAELAAELVAHVEQPPSGLFDQLDAEEQLMIAELADMDRLADRIQAHEDALARLQKRGAKLAADSKVTQRDRLTVRAFEAQAQLALAKEKHRGERTPEEIAILAEEVRILDKLHRDVTALYMVGAKGGESERWGLTGYHLCRARAELELASGNRPAAIVELHKSCEFVEIEVHNLSICMSECSDLHYNLPDAVRRRTPAWTRLYEQARLLGDKTQMDWAQKHGG